MRIDERKADGKLEAVDKKKDIELKDREFMLKAILALRRAYIQLCQDTGYTPPGDVVSDLQTIKERGDRLDRINDRQQALKADIAAGKEVDIDQGWD